MASHPNTNVMVPFPFETQDGLSTSLLDGFFGKFLPIALCGFLDEFIQRLPIFARQMSSSSSAMREPTCDIAHPGEAADSTLGQSTTINPNPLNVYKGPNSIREYYDPDRQPLLPLVEIPAELNPFLDDGVHIYAKMMNVLPTNNVKALPALNMLRSTSITEKTRTVVEYSSGSTAVSMSIIARVLHGIEDTRAFLSNKTSAVKLNLMRFFGLKITLFGGPSQPDPNDPRGGIQQSRKLAEGSHSIFNPNQYINNDNPNAHIRWTGPQILKQLPNIDIFCTGMGTAGTITGCGTYLKRAKSSIICVGVCTAPGDRVPGPRAYSLLSPVEFPWKHVVDTVEEVCSFESYRLSMALSREGLICGPSSGFNLKGLHIYLQKRKDQGTLKCLAKDGAINCVFICCDYPYQYLDEYFEKLGEEYFHPITNKNLTKVDSYRYLEEWEISATDALKVLYEAEFPEKQPAILKPQNASRLATIISHNKPNFNRLNTSLIDLRPEADFTLERLPYAINIPLASLTPTSQSPYANSSVLETQWKELETIFENNGAFTTALLKECHGVVLVCFDGDTSRMATSILRAKGVEAFSIKGGMKGLPECMISKLQCLRRSS